jgi:hypothetical protein
MTIVILFQTQGTIILLKISWCCLYARGEKKIQKCRSHLKILGSRRETRSKFLAQGPQIIGAIVKNLVFCDLCTPECQRLDKHSAIKETFNVLLGCPPPYHYNYLQHKECDEPITNNVTNEWYSCISARVCHFAALVSAEYVPDVVPYWCTRFIATTFPILLRVSLFCGCYVDVDWVPVLSDVVVIFVSSIVVLTPNDDFWVMPVLHSVSELCLLLPI